MNLVEATNYFLGEVMDIPKRVPNYDITSKTDRFETKNITLTPREGSLSDYEIDIEVPKTYNGKIGWFVGFDVKGSSKFELTNRGDFSIIPTVFGIVADYYNSLEVKPDYIKYVPKVEEGETGDSSKRGRIYKYIMTRSFPNARLDIKNNYGIEVVTIYPNG